ncbi:T9SS type A sorting domain-containing protein [Aurantibacillus circumpalustris]|uniref:T9SS type A sorting domain-containing protein n=1 Tax=Aurantibacillus circumpalustris TaxID=3036359 RepID=UPI00295AE52C|nr:T9SS type A sorting domain-containing protein [Aurantibacillus circumpalustris]
MKRLFKFVAIIFLYGNIDAQVPNFTITNNSGTSILTCIQTSIVLTASTAVTPPNSFHWTGPSFNITAPSVTLTQAGTYTVNALDSMNNIFGTQQITISSNTLAQSSAVLPSIQTITCNTTVGATITSNASGNVTHTFVSPFGTSVIFYSSVASYTALGPGTYSHILLDNTNGCTSISTFTLVGSGQSFPTFSVTSPQNYTLGCGTKSIAIINIINAATSPTPGGPVSYTLMPLLGSNPVPPGTSGYTVAVPGIYYAIVKDNTTNCAAQIPLSIISNTATPNISASVPKQILDCNTSQVILQGNSSTNNVSMQWSFIGTPGIVASSTIQVYTNSITSTQTLVNTFTLLVIDNNSTCNSTSIIPIYQNLFTPNAIISSGGSTVITCITPTIMLTNASATGIPNTSIFPSNLPVIGFLWVGPNPQTPLSISTLYTAAIAGIYTLTAKDLNNGCTSIATKEISGGCDLVGIQKNNSSTIAIKTFPNPGTGFFTLVIDNFIKNVNIEIFNSIGVLVKKQVLYTNEAILNINEQANGIYIIRLVQNNSVIHTSKFVKE